MSRWANGVRILLMAAWAASAGAATAPEAAEFSWHATVNVPAGASMARVALPASALQRLQSRDARDVRVFNGAGEAVAFALRTPAASPATAVQTPIYDAHPLFAAAGAQRPGKGAVEVRMDTDSQRNSVWVQNLGELSAKKLEGTDGAAFPFWSADGKFVGFFADGHLKKVAAAGGPVTMLADTPNPRGGSWNQDNVIIYEPDYRDSIWKISAAGGTPQRLTKFENSKHTTHRWPRFLPDGKHFLFFATNHSGGSESGIYIGSLDDGSYKHVIDWNYRQR